MDSIFAHDNVVVGLLVMIVAFGFQAAPGTVTYEIVPDTDLSEYLVAIRVP